MLGVRSTAPVAAEKELAAPGDGRGGFHCCLAQSLGLQAEELLAQTRALGACRAMISSAASVITVFRL